MKEKLKKVLPDKLFYFVCLMRNKYYASFKENKIKKYISRNYYKIFGKNLDWKNPKTYNEKLNVSKYLRTSETKTKLTDKYLVRKWIEEIIGAQYLIPIIGVYNNFSDIDFNKLPNKFVIKCNHDSGSVLICKNKEELDIKKAKKAFDFYIKRNFAYTGFEMHYKDIKPKIIIEKYMGDSITDYKFLCFNGVPYFCRLDFDRFGNHMRNIYDIDWNLQSFNKGNYQNKIGVKKPSKYNEMVEIVKKLSKGLDQVRVDLYLIDEKIYFGEMTFTNGNGVEKFYPEKYDEEIGKLWSFK